MAVPEASVSLTGEVSAYARTANSGNMVTRHFCATCGAALFSINSAMPGMMFLRASSLDDLEVFKPQMHVFVSRAASWDHRHGELPVFDEMPPGM
jgi:hypothetical protein